MGIGKSLRKAVSSVASPIVKTVKTVKTAYKQAEGVVSTARDQTLAELDRAGILSIPQAPNMAEAAVYKAGEAGEEAATIDSKKKKLTKKTGTTTTAEMSVENIGTAIQQRIGV